MNSANFGHLDIQTLLWCRSLRRPHNDNLKVKREMEAKKKKSRLSKIGALQRTTFNSKVEVSHSPRSVLQTPCSQETPSASPRRSRPNLAQVQEGKKLLKMLRLDHILSDGDEEEATDRMNKKKGTEKKKKRSPHKLRSTLSKTPLFREGSPRPVKRNISPLTSWRMDDAGIPEPQQEKLNIFKEELVAMSSQKTSKEPVQLNQSSKDEENYNDGSQFVQWNHKPWRVEVGRESWQSDHAGLGHKEPHNFEFGEFKNLVATMQEEHRQSTRSIAETLEHHSRQIVLLTKANSSLANHVDCLEKEIMVLRAMQYVP